MYFNVYVLIYVAEVSTLLYLEDSKTVLVWFDASTLYSYSTSAQKYVCMDKCHLTIWMRQSLQIQCNLKEGIRSHCKQGTRSTRRVPACTILLPYLFETQVDFYLLTSQLISMSSFFSNSTTHYHTQQEPAHLPISTSHASVVYLLDDTISTYILSPSMGEFC